MPHWGASGRRRGEPRAVKGPFGESKSLKEPLTDCRARVVRGTLQESAAVRVALTYWRPP